MKKLICIFACLAVLVGVFSACRNKAPDETTTSETVFEQTTQKPVPERKVTLGYYKGKSLNPYKTESPTNRNLLTLVYDSLFLPADGYTVEPLIGLSFTNNEKMLTVTLDPDALFCDGSPIDPSDIVYSFNLAKESANYKERLRNFTTAAAGVGSVTFTLKSADIYAENCLTFPIVKYGTGDNSIPTGSGRYTLSKKSGNYYLTANEFSTRQEEMATKRISLVPITSDAGELYMLQTGDLTYFFDDLSDGEYTKIRANTTRVSMNNMIYLGINSQTTELKNKKVRDAICYAINKASLADSAYSGIATISDIPFNPTWEVVGNINTTLYEQNVIKAGELLDEAGYVFAYANNQYRSKNFEYIELSLLVNNENQPKDKIADMIAKSLKEIGVKVTVNSVPYEEYLSALQKGDYDLYVGEVKLSPNMSLTSFFSENGAVNYGIDIDGAVAKAYADFSGGKIDISTFMQVFSLEKPFIPLLFRDGMAYYSRELTYEDSVNEYELFANIYSWSVIN
jgi:peptide/nickel transport system substrate-binding protein